MWQTCVLEIGSLRAHIGGMRQHAIFVIAAGAMIALSVFFALRPHHIDTGVRPPYGGLIGSKCATTPDNGQMPLEYSCERP
jgi:hypothetical protein